MNFPKTGSTWTLNKVLLACALSGAFTFAISHNIKEKSKTKHTTTAPLITPGLNILRLNDFKFTHPLLMAHLSVESTKFNNLNTEINSFLLLEKQKNILTSASVFFMDLTDGSWTQINSQELYDPGSILKLPILLAYLKKDENEPGLFSKTIQYNGPDRNMPRQTITANTIKPGKSYTIKELIHYMIVDSDNEANSLLNRAIEPEYVYKVFRDIGIEQPEVNQSTVTMSCADVSKFLRVLYNSSYTSHRHSEFALQLLSESKFSEGMRNGLPDSILLVHKFGERGYQNTTFQEIHESGIIFSKYGNVLLTIMTKGNDQKEQTRIISDITRICFQYISKESVSN